MALLYDHVPFTRAPGAHVFGPRTVPDKAMSTLAVAAPAAGTDLTVQTGAGAAFPAPPFSATLDDGAGRMEIVRVASRNADTFVLSSGVARVWPIGTRYQVLTTISIRFARCTTARPTLWPNETTEIAAQLYLTVDGGPVQEGGGIGYVKAGALEEYDAAIAGGATAAEAAAALIAAGKLIFGAVGGIRVVRGVDLLESALTYPLIAGVNRVLTGTLGVKGGTFVTELTLETL